MQQRVPAQMPPTGQSCPSRGEWLHDPLAHESPVHGLPSSQLTHALPPLPQLDAVWLEIETQVPPLQHPEQVAELHVDSQLVLAPGTVSPAALICPEGHATQALD